MKINKIKNNGNEGFQIIDESGNEYFITEATEELAIAKYNEIKFREANPPKPSYRELRAQEYPPISDQLDMIYWDKVYGTNTWEKAISAVKERFPKG
ncbi:MAG: hypothetical protein KGZ42_07640 [Melioribacter sp.]|nr:hypothetical protein [Melioribacter sp.]